MSRSLVIVAFGLLAVVGCDDHGHDGPPAITSVTVEPASVAPGGTVTMVVETANFEVEGEHEHDGEGGDSPNAGHFHIYFDDLTTEPLLMPTTMTFEVDVPADATAGTHQLIVRLQHLSHLIIEPQVISAHPITIE